MSESKPGSQLSLNGPITAENRAEVLLVLGAEQYQSWQRDDPVFVESLLENHPAIGGDKETILGLIANEVHFRRQKGDSPRLAEYQKRFAELRDDLDRYFDQPGMDEDVEAESSADGLAGAVVNFVDVDDADALGPHAGMTEFADSTDGGADSSQEFMSVRESLEDESGPHAKPSADAYQFSDSDVKKLSETVNPELLDSEEGHYADSEFPDLSHSAVQKISESDVIPDSSLSYRDDDSELDDLVEVDDRTHLGGLSDADLHDAEEPELAPDSSLSFIGADHESADGDVSSDEPQVVGDSSMSYVRVDFDSKADGHPGGSDLEPSDEGTAEDEQQAAKERKPSYSLSYISVESLRIDSGTGSDSGVGSDVEQMAQGTFYTAMGSGTDSQLGSATAGTHHDISLGSVSDEEYRIIEEIGRGGMGVVYKAEQKSLKRIVAVKQLLGEGVTEYRVKRFRAEAEVIARLRHPNIVQIFDIGVLGGKHFFSLEFVSGGSLHGMINRTPQEINFSVQLMTQMADAMQIAHDAGIIHRDLKPGNVLMTEEGVPKITDFGLAKQFDNEDMGNTKTGAIMGTPSYMAPEQALGKVKEMGPPVDTYALGAIFYELLTGRPPFLAATLMDTLEQVRYEDPIPPSKLQAKVPRDLETICLKCLQKDPEKRYESSQALGDDLKRFQRGEPIQARASTALERWIKWAKRNPGTAATVAAGILVALGIVFGVIMFQQQKAAELRIARDEAKQEAEEAQKGLQQAQEQQKRDAERNRITTEIAQARADTSSNDQQKWVEARGRLRALINQHKNDANFGEEMSEARVELAKVEGKADAAQAYLDIQKLHSGPIGAMFYSTLATGETTDDNIEATERAVGEALERAGILPRDKEKAHRLSVALSPEDHKELTAICYEMLLIRAEMDALRAEDESLDAGARAKLLEQALSHLDRAEKLGGDSPHPTRVFFVRRNRYAAMLKDIGREPPDAGRIDEPASDTAMDSYLLGYEAFKDGNTEEAVTNFEQCLAKDTKHFWARYYLSVAYLRLKRFGAAKSSLTACLSDQEDFFWVYLLRAFANSQLQDDAGAQTDFAIAEAKLQGDRQRFALFANRGLFFYQKGLRASGADLIGLERVIAAIEYAQAEVDLLKAIELDPEKREFAPLLTLAQVYVKQERWEQALTQLTLAIERKKDFPDLYRLRAGLHLDRKDKKDKDLKAAYDDVESAISALNEKKKASASAFERKKIPPLMILKGRILYGQGIEIIKQPDSDAYRSLDHEKRFNDAITAYEDAVKRANELNESAQKTIIEESAIVDAYLGLGDANLKLNNFIAAKQAYDNYLKKGGKPRVEVYRGRGIARAQLRDNRGAIEDYSAALVLERGRGDPDPFVLTQQGWKWFSAGANEFALEDFQSAIKILLSDLDAVNAAGANLSDVEKLRRIEQINSKLANAHGGLAQTLFQMKRYQEALANYNRSIDLGQTEVNSYFGRGQTYLQIKGRKNIEMAIRDFQMAVKLSREDKDADEDADAHYSLAQSYSQLNRDSEALLSFRAALTLFKEQITKAAQPDKAERFRVKAAQACNAISRIAMQQKRFRESLEYAREAEKYGARDAELLCVSARIVALIAADNTVGNPEQYQARAIELLRKALDAAGREQPRIWEDEIANDAIFDPLRSRLDFSELEKRAAQQQ